jgi:alpha-tubulin suppressor-like RCC1 family protein
VGLLSVRAAVIAGTCFACFSGFEFEQCACTLCVLTHDPLQTTTCTTQQKATKDSVMASELLQLKCATCCRGGMSPADGCGHPRTQKEPTEEAIGLSAHSMNLSKIMASLLLALAVVLPSVHAVGESSADCTTLSGSDLVLAAADSAETVQWNSQNVYLNSVVDITATRASACVLTDLNIVKCWGKISIAKDISGTSQHFITHGARSWFTVNSTSDLFAHSEAPHYIFDRVMISNVADSNVLCGIMRDSSLACTTVSRNASHDGFDLSTPTYIFSGSGASSKVVSASLCSDQDTGCAVLSSGAVSCWSLANLRAGARRVQMPPSFTNATMVQAGGLHACALSQNGSVACFGNGDSGQLASMDSTGFNASVIIEFPSAVLTLGTGRAHTCVALQGAAVVCWGSNSRGQAGDDGTTDEIITEGDVPIAGDDVASFALGNFHSCALMKNASVYCWGDFRRTAVATGVPTLATEFTTTANNPVQQITAGNDFTCVVFKNRRVKCIGSNTANQLRPRIPTTTALSPRLPLGAPFDPMWSVEPISIRQISSSAEHTCVTLSTGAVTCFGAGDSGQLGTGKTDSVVRALGMVNLGNKRNKNSGLTAETYVVRTVTGASHTCSLLLSGAVKCWGANVLSSDQTLTPYEYPDLGYAPESITDIAAGGDTTCIVVDSSLINCFGSSLYGQTSVGVATDFQLPDDTTEIAVGDLVSDSAKVAKLSVGSQFACALYTTATNATIVCWGCLPPGTSCVTDTDVEPRELFPPGAYLPVDIVVGGQHACVLFSDGSIRCFGKNDHGQLGKGDTTNQPNLALASRVTFASGSPAVAVAVGTSHSCAILASGCVSCWGLGTSAQLGDGGLVDRTSPPAACIALNQSAVAIAAGSAHTCVVLQDQSVQCWGDVTSIGVDTDLLPDPTADFLTRPVSAFAIPASTTGYVAGTSGLQLAFACGLTTGVPDAVRVLKCGLGSGSRPAVETLGVAVGFNARIEDPNCLLSSSRQNVSSLPVTNLYCAACELSATNMSTGSSVISFSFDGYGSTTVQASSAVALFRSFKQLRGLSMLNLIDPDRPQLDIADVALLPLPLQTLELDPIYPLRCAPGTYKNSYERTDGG